MRANLIAKPRNTGRKCVRPAHMNTTFIARLAGWQLNTEQSETDNGLTQGVDIASVLTGWYLIPSPNRASLSVKTLPWP